MSFVYPATSPKTPNEKFIAGILTDLEYGKLTRFCEYLRYEGVDEFLENLKSEFDWTNQLNSEELLKRSYPYRLSIFKNYKDVWFPIIGRIVRASRISFFEEQIFDKVIRTWIAYTFQSNEYTISEQKSRLKLFETFSAYMISSGLNYSVKIIELAGHELEKRIQREMFPVENVLGSKLNILDDSQANKIVAIANELVNSGFLDDPVNFSQVFFTHIDIITDESRTKWRGHLSDLSWLLVLIDVLILNRNKDQSQAQAIIESKFSDANGKPFSKTRIMEALTRSRKDLDKYPNQHPKKSKSKAPILYTIVKNSL